MRHSKEVIYIIPICMSSCCGKSNLWRF